MDQFDRCVSDPTRRSGVKRFLAEAYGPPRRPSPSGTALAELNVPTGVSLCSSRLTRPRLVGPQQPWRRRTAGEGWRIPAGFVEGDRWVPFFVVCTFPRIDGVTKPRGAAILDSDEGRTRAALGGRCVVPLCAVGARRRRPRAVGHHAPSRASPWHDIVRLSRLELPAAAVTRKRSTSGSVRCTFEMTKPHRRGDGGRGFQRRARASPITAARSSSVPPTANRSCGSASAERAPETFARRLHARREAVPGVSLEARRTAASTCCRRSGTSKAGAGSTGRRSRRFPTARTICGRSGTPTASTATRTNLAQGFDVATQAIQLDVD